jgi:Excalibur calcium-binding domain
VKKNANRAVVAAVSATLGLALAAPGVSAKDKDCSDFKSQRAAQKFFKKHNPKRDPHRLDADGDGKACEDYDY